MTADDVPFRKAVVWLAPAGYEVDAVAVFRVLSPHESHVDTAITMSRRKFTPAEGAACLERAFVSATSGRADADELRAAFALGGWVAVRDLLEAQGFRHG